MRRIHSLGGVYICTSGFKAFSQFLKWGLLSHPSRKNKDAVPRGPQVGHP